jgi:hypothetical protein
MPLERRSPCFVTLRAVVRHGIALARRQESCSEPAWIRWLKKMG